MSIRKGKKIVSYDYNALLKWECVLKDGEGTQVGLVKGTYEMPEISSDMEDDGEEWEVKLSVKEDEGKVRARVEGMLKKEAANCLRKAIIEGFVKELKLK